MAFHSSIWPAEYLCPISRSVMVDPVIVSSGQTYERRCIEAWLDIGQTHCVKQSTPLTRDFIVPNIALRNAIANFTVSRGMHALPSPPSPRLARMLAENLISELRASSHSMQASDFSHVDARCISDQEDPFEEQSEHMIDQVDAEGEKRVFDPDVEYVKSCRNEEIGGEGHMIHSFSTLGIRDDNSLSSHSLGYGKRNTATRGQMDRRTADVKSSKASREQRESSRDGHNRHNTAGVSADRYGVRQQSDNLERFRVSREQPEVADEIHIARADADMSRGQSESVRNFRVSREGDGYNRYTAAAQEDTDLENMQFANVRGVRVFREQRELPHDSYNGYVRETVGDANVVRRELENVEGVKVSNEQLCSSQDGYYIAAAQGDIDPVRAQSRNVEGLRDSREQRTSSHKYGYSRYPKADGLCHEYGKYSRTDGYVTSPIPSRYSHSASGDILLKSNYGRGELPPHLVTKPSSYSSAEASAPLTTSLSSSHTTISLIEKLRDPLLEVREAAIIELRQLTRMSAENRISLSNPDVINALLPHLKSESSVAQINGAAALVNFCLEKQNKVMIVRSGAVPHLVEVLNHGIPEAQEHAAGAIFSLALADENKDPIGVLNAIPPLVRLLRSSRAGARHDAAMALYQLSLFENNRSKLVKVGAVPILLNLAESKDKPDLASRVLLIICNVAAIPEGRAALLEHNAIAKLVKLLAVRSNKDVPEQAVAALLLLSKGNRRFKAMAASAGAQELLTALVDVGTPRAREKALALLAIMKESLSAADSLETDEMLSRQYLRRNKGRVDGVFMNSSAF